MYCPEHLVFKTKRISIWMYGSSDIQAKYIPLSWWLNPLRYEICIRNWRLNKILIINNEGMYRIKLLNFVRNIRSKK